MNNNEMDLGNTSSGMQPQLAACLSYSFGFLTGLIFYFTEKENKFVRFHAMQSIITFLALMILQMFSGLIPFIGVLLLPIISITALILWVLLMIKAYQGEKFSLPIAGEIAEKNS